MTKRTRLLLIISFIMLSIDLIYLLILHDQDVAIIGQQQTYIFRLNQDMSELEIKSSCGAVPIPKVPVVLQPKREYEL